MGKRPDKAVDSDTVFANYQAIHSKTFVVSLLVEFIGVMMFSFLGSTVTNPILAPFVNGFALTVWIYAAANISGGHLNPAVSLSCMICGFYPVMHTFLYITLQIAGGIFGSLLAAGLVPGASIGMGEKGPGCFTEGTLGPGLTKSQLFGWEALMTFTLISCVYACGVAKPGHGSHTPLAVGLSLLACAGTGAGWTGAALNPARVIGPLVVFSCGQGYAWIYILAQLLAALCACCIFAFVSGLGPLNPLTSTIKLRLSMPEAITMMVTGSPPKRLQRTGDENITEIINDLGGDLHDVSKTDLKTLERDVRDMDQAPALPTTAP